MKILVTGVAGFIGMHLAERLLADGHEVVGVDNVNDYYDVTLKENRLQRLLPHPGFTFHRQDVADGPALMGLFAATRPPRVVHLAAQAGVRYSLENPLAYITSNVVGFAHILEGCRHHGVEHLVYASSSSVYGANATLPFSVHDNVDHPLSLYAATKKADELLAHTYSHLYRLPTTGLRFFTVYGPWGRPDMAASLFARAILAGQPIKVYNQGHMRRDFTYVDDIIEGIVRVLDQPAAPNPHFDRARPDPGTSDAPYRIYNIGNHQPVDLLTFIGLIEKGLGRSAVKVLLPMQPGDVAATCADIQDLSDAVGFTPHTPLETGIGRFLEWLKDYRW